MIIYLNRYNETIWHNKKNCEQDLDECLDANLIGGAHVGSFSIMQKALDICEAVHNKNYAYAGETMAKMIQLYEKGRDEFYNDFYATVECGDKEQMKKELITLFEADYIWGDEECDTED